MVYTVRLVARRLADLEIWSVGLAVAVGVIVPRTLPIVLSVALLWWGIRWLGYGRLSVRTPIDWSVALLGVMLPVTLWVTVIPDTTLPQVYRLLSGIALYYAIVNWTTNLARLRLLLVGVVVIGLLLAGIAPLTVQWGGGKLPLLPDALYTRLVPIVADTVNPNVMAGLLVLLLPLLLALTLFDGRHWSRLAYLLTLMSLPMMGGTLLLTQSRGALLALAAALMLLIGLRWRHGWLLTLMVVVALISAMVLVGATPLLDLVTTSRTFGGFDKRIEIWSRAIYMIHDFPFTGIGMGAFGMVTDRFYPLFLTAPDTIPHAHNLFLQIAVDLGIPGLIAWVAIVLGILAGSWQVYRHGCMMGDGWVTGMGAGLLGSQVALLVHGLTDAVTWGMVRPAVLVWGIWGIAMANWQMYTSTQSHSAVAK
jgi:putative inorganic carbon (HCO3(-)) transporter